MSGPQSGPDPPAELASPVSAASASGLDEGQLDQADLAALQELFRFRQLDPALSCIIYPLADWQIPEGLSAAALKRVELNLPAVAAQGLRMVPLPGKARNFSLLIQPLRPRLHKDLPLAWAQPVRRTRVLPAALRPAERESINRAMVAKYGADTRFLTLQAVFREVPPECAKTVRLDEALRFCQFSLPAGSQAAKLRQGYALAIATGESGKTYPALARL